MFSLDRSRNDTSLTLDLLRAVAAQMVCVGHAINFFMGGWPGYLPFMQNVGVLLFFLISGFLITFTLVERSKNPDYGFGQFVVERFARIYSGLIPALVLVVIIDGIVIRLTGEPTVARYYDLKTFIANLFMLEGYQGVRSDILQWSAFGSASPLWTLAIEWHIYIFVAAIFFVGARPLWIPLLIPAALFFGQTPVHLLLGAFQQDGVGRGLFALWLGGSLIYFASRWCGAGLWWGIVIMGLAISGYFAFTHAAAEYSFRTYPLLIAAFFGLVIATQATHIIVSVRVRNLIRFLADYSFSLYLIHHTLMYAIWRLWPGAGLPGFIMAIILSNIVAMAMAEIGEKHHKNLAGFFKRGLPARASSQAAE